MKKNQIITYLFLSILAQSSAFAGWGGNDIAQDPQDPLISSARTSVPTNNVSNNEPTELERKAYNLFIEKKTPTFEKLADYMAQRRPDFYCVDVLTTSLNQVNVQEPSFLQVETIVKLIEQGNESSLNRALPIITKFSDFLGIPKDDLSSLFEVNKSVPQEETKTEDFAQATSTPVVEEDVTTNGSKRTAFDTAEEAPEPHYVHVALAGDIPSSDPRGGQYVVVEGKINDLGHQELKGVKNGLTAYQDPEWGVYLMEGENRFFPTRHCLVFPNEGPGAIQDKSYGGRLHDDFKYTNTAEVSNVKKIFSGW